MYRIVSAELKRPPKTIAELRKAESEVPGGFSMLGESNVEIYFNAALPEVQGKSAADTGQTILAFERTVPLQGGLALMLDRSIRRMSVEEFKAAKKFHWPWQKLEPDATAGLTDDSASSEKTTQ